MKVLALRNLGVGLPSLKEGETGCIDDKIGNELLASKRPPIQVVDEPKAEVKPETIPATEPVQAEVEKSNPAITSKKPKS